MHLVDSLNQSTSISIPDIGAVPVGLLPDGIDLQLLQTELIRFYGDRFSLVEPSRQVAAPKVEPIRQVAPKAKRKAGHGF